jgi:hypothetical protein
VKHKRSREGNRYSGPRTVRSSPSATPPCGRSSTTRRSASGTVARSGGSPTP